MATLLDEVVGSSLATRELIIDFMYLDLETCTRCQGTDANLEAALTEAKSILAVAGIRASIQKTQVESMAQAQALGFASSPTIRVNGQDIALDLRQSHCADCTVASGSDEPVNCRVWHWQGEEHTVAPKAMIVDAILNEIYSGKVQRNPPAPTEPNVTANLERYFSGQEQAAAVSNSCCSPTEQASCCEPSQKASCCGESASAGGGCGCR